MQVVAGRLQDHLTLDVALYLEGAFGGWRQPGSQRTRLTGVDAGGAEHAF